MLTSSIASAQFAPPPQSGCIRVATYNASLNRNADGELAKQLKEHDAQIQAVATVIRQVRPDVLLINEIDYAANEDNAATFESRYLANSQPDLLNQPAWPMPHHYSNSVNTGIPSGLDLNNDGDTTDPDDAFGFGRFPGQYGMAVFSRYEIDRDAVTTFQKFLWSRLPNALRPFDPKTDRHFYDDPTWAAMRLSSKSLWKVPVKTPQGTLCVIASHPTPPAFDGPEDRNGCRNHDEIKMIELLIQSSPALIDDAGQPAAIDPNHAFVIMGDLNCDPMDGDGKQQALHSLLRSPLLAKATPPSSQGGAEASSSQGKANLKHRSKPTEDTADFSDNAVGNLRADYVLPSRHCKVVASGVAWPTKPEAANIAPDLLKKLNEASDHHLVWVDIEIVNP